MLWFGIGFNAFWDWRGEARAIPPGVPPAP